MNLSLDPNTQYSRKRANTACSSSERTLILHHSDKKPRVRSPRSPGSHFKEKIKKQEEKEKGEHERHKLLKKKEYLTGNFETSICLPKKKKGSSKIKKISLFGDGIQINDSKNDNIYPLSSLCMIQQENELIKNTKLSPRKSKFASPFASRKDKTNSSDKTMLICTQNLTRIWIKFNEKEKFLEWLLCIDGLLGIFYSSSLLSPINKTIYLRDRYLVPFKGGVIKIGDDEEWNYNYNGHVSCSLTKRNDLKNCEFIFDGQYFRGDSNSPFKQCGEWDGMNVYWFTNSLSGDMSERRRRKMVSSCYNWNSNTNQYEKIEKGLFECDTRNTWKLTRNFLAQIDGMGSGWIQIEGDIPICIGMFLKLFYLGLKNDNEINDNNIKEEKKKEIPEDLIKRLE